MGLGIAILVVGVVVGAGVIWRGSSDASSSDKQASGRSIDGIDPPTTTTEADSTTTTAATTTAAPTTTTAIPAPVPVPPLPAGGLPDVGPNGLGVGATGPVVQAYEQRLADLHFDPGAVDGTFDGSTQYAVQGFQKLIGADRNGRINEGERFALSVFQRPKPLAVDNPEADRVEVDVARQVLVLYQGYQVRLITPVSTGAGEHYCYTPKGHPELRSCEYALTPSGKFAFTDFRKGWDTSPLGHLYNPYYFNGGIAVHGYQSVPVEPASHGCVRIPMYVSEYFHTLVTHGEAVYVFNGSDHKSPVETTHVAPPPPTVPVAPPLDTAPTAPVDPGATTTAPPVTDPTTAPPATTAPIATPAAPASA